jgi:hypothetical protein
MKWPDVRIVNQRTILAQSITKTGGKTVTLNQLYSSSMKPDPDRPTIEIKLAQLYALKDEMIFKADQAALRVQHYAEELESIEAQIDHFEDAKARANMRRQSGSWLEAELNRWLRKLDS